VRVETGTESKEGEVVEEMDDATMEVTGAGNGGNAMEAEEE